MVCYAQINENKVCVGVSILKGEVDSPLMIAIPSADEDYLWRKYENGIWSTTKYMPENGTVAVDRLEALEQQNAQIILALVSNDLM